ncbi:GTP-binding protein [Rufibacter glacialis]|uniref:GTP-binding protein n=1 Tax=Rufibacter glacialis TaxID=1259555 RepID=A0A5M8Q946_9BACT|nr:GTP-binding protein [Rufibacter glacialis]KAA6432467.1 GTP-binding protein [Rufibacter glacialis]GGK78901.1 cobalamin biosynthesis protein CobW [Rufibacter glacialis]
MSAKHKLPVTIVTGFLGSGKTTLLQHALRQQGMQDTAVLVNEFGMVGLDHHLLQMVEESTILLGGGCVCCSTRDDLVQALTQLLNRVQKGERDVSKVVIETTGLADPAPIVFTVLSHPVLQHHFHIQNVIVTVDAVNGLFHLRRQPESVKQALVADKFIITKTDLAPGEEVKQLLRELQVINPSAGRHTAVHGVIDAALLFSPAVTIRQRAADPAPVFQEKGTHVQDVNSVSITFREPLDWTAFGLWLSMLLHAKGEDIMRVKGLLDIGGAGPVILNGVQHIIHPPNHLEAWPSEERVSTLVFIMRSVSPEEILTSLEAFQKAFDVKHNMPEMEILQ